MGLFDIARDALKEIPMADIMRARLELAFDQSTVLEKQLSTLRDEYAELKAELKIAKASLAKTETELRLITEKHKEEIRISSGVEFRRGERTGNEWLSFCPRCHIPILLDRDDDYPPSCADDKCGWVSSISCHQITRP